MPIFTREMLYELVWAEPLRTIAAAYEVSSFWLKQACTSLEVPTPSSGHWAKLRAGKLVVQPSLPLRRPGMPENISTPVWRWDPEAELAEPLPEPPVFGEPIEAVRVRVIEQVGTVTAICNLDAPCGTIRKLLDQDKWRRAQKVADKWGSGRYQPLFNSPFERRRLQVLNSLARGFAKSGAKLEVRDDEARDLAVRVGNEHLPFTLDHPGAEPTILGKWRTRPGAADVLRLEMQAKLQEAGVPRLWIDDDSGKLEDRLTDIVVSFFIAAEIQHRAGQVSHHAWLITRRAENEAELMRRDDTAERKRLERRRKKQRARREFLLGQARDWRTAQDIRGFVGEVLSEHSAEPDKRRLREWSAWALVQADSVDPIKRGLTSWKAARL